MVLCNVCLWLFCSMVSRLVVFCRKFVLVVVSVMLVV